ncbi:MAG TPA: ATP-dependent DNA helicase [Trebonia sp.]|nr:ATP-dependent DNA helicase [Trebonia sp.]
MPVQYTPEQLARLLRLPEPTREQAAVISAPLGPMAVIAGAGSGKSETMAARVVWLIANRLVRPDRVLGLTFTRRAAAELADRVRSRMDRLRRAGLAGGGTGEGPAPDRGADEPAPDDAAGAWAGDPVIGTYHAYAGRLVSDHALREGIEPSLRLITPAPAWQLAASIVAAYDGPMDQIGWTPQTVTNAVQQLSGDLAEHLRSPADIVKVGQWLDGRYAAMAKKTAAARRVMETQRAREQLLPMVRRYRAAKQAREVLDHGDQIALAARIATRHPQVGTIERSRYQVVLLDEYQDTSHAQLVLLLSLFGGGHPVTAVGDPSQSIYGWRGASAGNLLRFAEDFRQRNGDESPVRALSVSFRNSGQVLDVAAVLQSPLRAEAPGVPLLIPAPEASARGTVTCALLPTVTGEADWVAARTAALLALPPGCAPDGKPWPDGRSAGVRPSDIAILCRKRSQFEALRQSLGAAGIPCEVVGLGGLLGLPEVQDVVATLRVMHDATASDSLARILTGPRWRIGPRDLITLGSRARELATGLQDLGPAAEPPAPGEPPAAGETQAPVESALAVQAGDAGPAWTDALTEVVTDLTSEGGSLVEALDDLGQPDGYSAAGYARLIALAAELRRLRQYVSRPLPDLIAEIERTLSLDIEVAARPGSDPGTARADLDKFTDVAATFAGEQSEATLGAFLAYLTAAQQEEFGLETGRVGEADTVKLLTVHAAKGLQWPAVFMPGLAAGEKSQVFPARPRTSTRWTDNSRLLPFSLRGDAADLPQLDGLDSDSLNAFTAACTARDVAEERRLAYVAATRAAFWLGCSGYWWGDGTVPLGPSVFLDEVRQACEAGAGAVGEWAGQPAGDAANPLLATVEEADWPATPAGRAYEEISSAGRLVRKAMRTGAGAGDSSAPPVASPAPLTAAEADLVAAWDLDAGLLLAERERRRERGEGPVPVLLPSRLSVSALVTLARDPGELARQVRRPMPQPPARQARRGTEFHQWLEERFGQQRLIGDDDLFADPDSPPDVALGRLRERFEAGEWGKRWPREVEVPFDTVIGDRQVRGRIDAVFADRDGTYDVVDWKTGQPPRTQAGRNAVAVQLAAYRLAWSALAGVPIGQVRAAFYYVRHDLTVRPADLLDEAGLKALIEQVPLLD